MPQVLTGFVIRRASADEAAQIMPLLGGSGLKTGRPVVYGAFGQPGNIPLGGMLVLPLGPGLAVFQLSVLPPYRRRSIGTRFIQTLLTDARQNGFSRLRMAKLVHQDQPENAFYLKLGFLPERSFVTYTMALASQMNGVGCMGMNELRLRNANDCCRLSDT